MRIIVILLILFLSSPTWADAVREVAFSQFSAELPEDWDGDEQTGFISDSSAEYSLTLACKDESGDNYAAQVTVYLLPNKPGVTAQEAAKRLTEAQGEPTEPREKDHLWVFEGEPRSRTIKGRATTFVNANPEDLLIIIAQDQKNLGADKIVKSLKGLTPRARGLLGR